MCPPATASPLEDCLEAYTLHTPDSRLEGMLVLPTDSQPEKAIVMLHGFCSNRYGLLPYAQYFAEQGYLVAAFDARGHGESEGGLDVLDMVSDVGEICGTLQREYGVESIGLFGLSMGGWVASVAAAEVAAVDAVVSVSGAVHPAEDFLRRETVLSPLFRILFPLLERMEREGSDIPLPRQLSRLLSNRRNLWALETLVENLKERYFSIPGLSSDRSLMSAYRMFRDGPDAKEYAPRVQVPFLIYQGEDDVAVPTVAQQELLDALGTEDKELRILDGGHTIWSRHYWKISRGACEFFDSRL